ncbi:major facilitator superfamily protein [Halorubrum aidingense JCM 13560]|uniref:Major facilitator superfamily protein n=1 Tax=Halorubrum aidingense JCM 13560 TaxID=1230454 RepID=M0P8H5_9EURY|nr:MFS transporter [Halorubrum aidingense]EMA65115.1 major facilitator superfamily protein [Halorubrum aidingense JCM 13560]
MTDGDTGVDGGEGAGGDDVDLLDPFRQFFSLRRDVLVLSLAMFAFSLGFQMTNRYVPEYLSALGASAFVIGLFGTVGNVIGAVYPYPGGRLSDRIGSRVALTLFGLLSSLGFAVWLVAPTLGTVTVAGVVLEPWIWIFVGLFLAQAWKSFGLGATFAIVKQSVPPARLARGFASTEVFRRSAFLIGPLIAAGVIQYVADFTAGFQYVLAVALLFAVVATGLQHVLYDASEDTLGKEFEGVREVVDDLRTLPPELRPLLVGDTLVRFANGMVYVFFVIVITQFLEVGLDVGPLSLSPPAFFGVLLAIEMLVALVSMPPAARVAERVGLKPVVALGFLVYAVFPVLLISVPADTPLTAPLVVALFAFSGLRFAGLPAHKALIVGPAERDAGGRVSGSYYLVRNAIVIPSAALGGLIYGGFSVPTTGLAFPGSPTVAFGLASAFGLVGVAYFALFGEEYDAYA